ncbi:DUF4097 family beta strand repeat-containing protein [Paenibacillus yanchengensis]|uniref:DUF4097 family beta strand repeat-containing protein n=1 Tax=Paenibacillus yanchengensis TaxID=2035833 RepID=A0ABW4YLL2_9BACL
MSSIKKLTIIALLLLVVSIIGSIATYKQSYEKKLSVEKIELTNSNFDNIQLTSRNSSIELLQTTQPTAYLELIGIKKNQKFSYSINDATLTIEDNNKQNKFFNLGIPQKASIKIYLPGKQYNTITIKKEDGILLAENIVAKQFSIKGNDGLITFKNTEAAMYSIEALDAILHFEHIKGALNTKMMDGKVKIISSQLQYPVDIALNDGIINIETSKEPQDTTIQLQYNDGIVSLFGQNKTYAQFGNGENKINLSIKDGLIEVKKQTD